MSAMRTSRGLRLVIERESTINVKQKTLKKCCKFIHPLGPPWDPQGDRGYPIAPKGTDGYHMGPMCTCHIMSAMRPWDCGGCDRFRSSFDGFYLGLIKNQPIYVTSDAEFGQEGRNLSSSGRGLSSRGRGLRRCFHCFLKLPPYPTPRPWDP